MRADSFQQVFESKAVQGPPRLDGVFALHMTMPGIFLPPILVAEVCLRPQGYAANIVHLRAGPWEAFVPEHFIHRHLSILGFT